jgi:uncharacterized protein
MAHKTPIYPSDLACRLDAVKPAQLLRVAGIAEDRATNTARSSTVHGPRHWRDVAQVAYAIHARNAGFDLVVTQIFAMLHDSQRKTDGHDRGHGKRAASIAASMRADGVITLSERRWQLLRKALVEHERGTRSDDPTIGACWDADRSTLWRVGIRPEPRFFSTGNAEAWIGIGAAAVVASAPGTWKDILGGVKTDGPKVLYHGTHAENLLSIMQTGIRESSAFVLPSLGGSITTQAGSYLTPSRAIADKYARWKVDLQVKDHIDRFKTGEVESHVTQARLCSATKGAVLTVHVPADVPCVTMDAEVIGFVLPRVCPPTWIKAYDILDFGSGSNTIKNRGLTNLAKLSRMATV